MMTGDCVKSIRTMPCSEASLVTCETVRRGETAAPHSCGPLGEVDLRTGRPCQLPHAVKPETADQFKSHRHLTELRC